MLNPCFRRSERISALQSFQQKGDSLDPCFICVNSLKSSKMNIVEEEAKTQRSFSPNADLQNYQLPELG